MNTIGLPIEKTVPDPPGDASERAPARWFGARQATVSLVLPMFNEGPAVDFTMAHALEALERGFTDFEIVVADDASTDDSAQQVEHWAACDPRIRLVRLPRNQRFGGALCAGLDAATKEFLFYTDFDVPVDLTVLPRLLDEFAEADVLTGYAETGSKYVDRRSQFISLGYNFMVRSLFGLTFRDINFGFKAIRQSVWNQLTMRSTSPFVDAEMFVQALRLGYRVKEVPVPFSPRHLGHSRIRRADVISWTMWDMARLRLSRGQRRGAAAHRLRHTCMKLLVTNADDFGLDPAINAAVVQAHTAGILTSASLLIGAPHADQAVEFARAHPSLRVGVHLCLVDGWPVAPRAEIAALTDAAGTLPQSPFVLSVRLACRPHAEVAVETELRAQMQKFLATGLQPTHVDTHQHTHLHPRVLRIVARLAREHAIPWVRWPVEPLWPSLRCDGRHVTRTLARWLIFGMFGAGVGQVLRQQGLRSAGRAVGVLNPGQLTEEFLLAYLPRLADEVTEIFFHPAVLENNQLRSYQPGYQHASELRALCSPRVRDLVRKLGVRLVNFRGLSDSSDSFT